MEQEQIDALKKALHDVPVMISACAAIKISESEKFHSELLSFIQGNFAILSRKPIVFVLERQVPIRVGEKLTVREASKQLAAGACVIRLGLDLSICATTKTKPDMASCCKAGLGTYAAFVEGEALHEILLIQPQALVSAVAGRGRLQILPHSLLIITKNASVARRIFGIGMTKMNVYCWWGRTGQRRSFIKIFGGG